MTDRHAGYLVVLDLDIRADDAAAVMDALLMIRGVAAVTEVPADPSVVIAKMRSDAEWRDALVGFLQERLAGR